MSNSQVQRFTKGSPCPICGGSDNLPRGKGVRCHGFLSSDGAYAHCSREDQAGTLPLEINSDTYAHRLTGDCHCGTRHDPLPPESPKKVTRGKSRIVAAYDYRTSDGALLYQVVRYEPKEFRQRRPDGSGGWIWNLDGIERVPYHLPELLAADLAEPVHIVEGEKDAESLTKLGLIATTNSGGAGKWHESYNRALVGRVVIILPDNDKSGRDHAEHVARSLLDIAASVRVLHLPDLPAKGDVYDWVATGGTAADLAALADAAPMVDARFAPIGSNEHRANERSPGFALTILADLLKEADEEVAWVVAEVLPTAGSSLMSAKPKVGKTTLVRNLALDVSRGDPFLGRATKQGTVLYLALEEKRGKVKEHFHDLGATDTDCAPLFVHVGSAPDNPLAELRALIERHRPVLVIIDPLQRFLRLKDGNDYAQVTNAMEPLTDLARNSGAHIVCIHHANKGGHGGGDGVLGSTGFYGAVDTLISLRRDGDKRTIATEQRYGEDLPETTLILDKATGRTMLGTSVEAEERRDLAGAIRSLLRPGALDEPTIRQRIGGDQKESARELRALVERGEVVRMGAGKKGSPYLYGLAESADPPLPPPRILDARSDRQGGSDHRASRATEPTEGLQTWAG